jgi:acyl-homoserine lactone acylase PvdQ
LAVGYGMGRAQAQDRLFQMELVRKSATDNVAELFGIDFLSDDEDARSVIRSENRTESGTPRSV